VGDGHDELASAAPWPAPAVAAEKSVSCRLMEIHSKIATQRTKAYFDALVR